MKLRGNEKAANPRRMHTSQAQSRLRLKYAGIEVEYRKIESWL